MDKELKNLVIEIISLVLLLVIMVPICVNASNNYKESKEVLLSGRDTTVDISNNGDIKKLTIYCNYDKTMKVNLVMKISKFSNDYLIYLEDDVYEIRSLEYTEDEYYQYYNLGVYEVDKKREFDFQLKAKGADFYNETIMYSFMTKGL